MGHRRLAQALALVLVAGLLVPPTAAAEPALEQGGPDDAVPREALHQGETVEPAAGGRIPDQVHPPVEGEAEPPADPSEPDELDLAPQSAPRAQIALSSGERWGSLDLSTSASDPATASVRASRRAHGDGAEHVVVARHNRWAARAAGASLAAIVDGPLLLTPIGGLTDGVRDELERLDPATVHIVGLREDVAEVAEGLGAATWRTNAGDDDELARRVAFHAAGLEPERSAAPELAAACDAETVPRSRLADVVGSHHELAVDCAAWHGLVNGVSPYVYRPRESLTRGQAASVLERLLEAADALPPEAPQPFDDVEGSAHAEAIARLAGAGIITGRDATTYAPREPVRRAELTSLIVRALEHAEHPLDPAGHDFGDVDAASAHDEAIGAAAAAGIIRGVSDEAFAPFRSVRRDHAAVMLARTLARLAEDEAIALPEDVDAPPRPLVLVGANDARRGIGAVALAAGLGAHVLVVDAGTTSPGQAANDAAALGGGRAWAAGSEAGIPEDVVEAVGARRVTGGGPVTSTGRLADVGRSLGLRGTPAVVDADIDELAASAVAAFAAGQRGAVAVATADGAVSEWAAERLADWRPGRVHAASTLSDLARCQLASGQERTWGCAEAELDRQGYYNLGAVDGRVSQQTTFALYAFQKLAGLSPEARFTDAHWDRLLEQPTRRPRHTSLGHRHIEIDIGSQLILFFRGNELVHAFHTSTGKPSTPTIRGVFSLYWMRPERRPNGMYRSMFFQGGYALHGYPSIPTYPASAGCARMDDRDAEVLYRQVRVGDRVAVY